MADYRTLPPEEWTARTGAKVDVTIACRCGVEINIKTPPGETGSAACETCRREYEVRPQVLVVQTGA